MSLNDFDFEKISTTRATLRALIHTVTNLKNELSIIQNEAEALEKLFEKFQETSNKNDN